jgi:hypothetical protein
MGYAVFEGGLVNIISGEDGIDFAGSLSVLAQR